VSTITNATTRGEFRVGDVFEDGRVVVALETMGKSDGESLIAYAIDYPYPYPRPDLPTHKRTWYAAERASRTYGADLGLGAYMHSLSDNS
jgi:hypothetical protein